MADKDLPDWATEMDREILEIMSIGWTVSPTIIAENIDRSREAVSRRLNTLEAGGLVKKIDRGKYEITEEGEDSVETRWKKVEDDRSEEEIRQDRIEEIEQRKRIEKEFGVSEKEFLRAASKEQQRLEDKGDPSDDLFDKALSIVADRLREEQNNDSGRDENKDS